MKCRRPCRSRRSDSCAPASCSGGCRGELPVTRRPCIGVAVILTFAVNVSIFPSSEFAGRGGTVGREDRVHRRREEAVVLRHLAPRRLAADAHRRRDVVGRRSPELLELVVRRQPDIGRWSRPAPPGRTGWTRSLPCRRCGTTRTGRSPSPAVAWSHRPQSTRPRRSSRSPAPRTATRSSRTIPTRAGSRRARRGAGSGWRSSRFHR